MFSGGEREPIGIIHSAVAALKLESTHICKNVQTTYSACQLPN
jgi:hypothetical protein